MAVRGFVAGCPVLCELEAGIERNIASADEEDERYKEGRRQSDRCAVVGQLKTNKGIHHQDPCCGRDRSDVNRRECLYRTFLSLDNKNQTGKQGQAEYTIRTFLLMGNPPTENISQTLIRI